MDLDSLLGYSWANLNNVATKRLKSERDIKDFADVIWCPWEKSDVPFKPAMIYDSWNNSLWQILKGIAKGSNRYQQISVLVCCFDKYSLLCGQLPSYENHSLKLSDLMDSFHRISAKRERRRTELSSSSVKRGVTILEELLNAPWSYLYSCNPEVFPFVAVLAGSFEREFRTLYSNGLRFDYDSIMSIAQKLSPQFAFHLHGVITEEGAIGSGFVSSLPEDRLRNSRFVKWYKQATSSHCRNNPPSFGSQNLEEVLQNTYFAQAVDTFAEDEIDWGRRHT